MKRFRFSLPTKRLSDKSVRSLRKRKDIDFKFIILFLFLIGVCLYQGAILLNHLNIDFINLPTLEGEEVPQEEKSTIKWVDFDVPYTVLDKTMKLDIETFEKTPHVQWIDLLAYLGAKYGGKFKNFKEKDITAYVEKLESGMTVEEITKDMKHFSYYKQAYTAVLGGFLGEFQQQIPYKPEQMAATEQNLAQQNFTQENSKQQGYSQSSNPSSNSTDPLESREDTTWVKRYGLKAYSPIAEGYWYSDFDDFGAGRSYGYKRKHFGHDLMVSTGTPIIAIESGIVEVMGWNQYGGWRIGIRSFDGKRYYYYAHLRKDHPFNDQLAEGQMVKAGDVIGYSGRTGYSAKENVNNIDTPHLHVGMQLIFDEALKDSPNQIWVDLYSVTRLLSKHRATVYKDEEKKEYYRKYDIVEIN